MHHPMWEKGGIIYILHRSIQRTHHIYFPRLLQDCHTLCSSQRMEWQERRQKEISLEYLTEEKFYPLGTTDEYFEAPYEEYPITIYGQTVTSPMGSLQPPCNPCWREIGKSYSFFIFFILSHHIITISFFNFQFCVIFPLPELLSYMESIIHIYFLKWTEDQKKLRV